MQDLADQENPWTVYVETLPPDSGMKELPPFDKDSEYIKLCTYTIYLKMSPYSVMLKGCRTKYCGL